jgi:hypothetical protein
MYTLSELDVFKSFTLLIKIMRNIKKIILATIFLAFFISHANAESLDFPIVNDLRIPSDEWIKSSTILSSGPQPTETSDYMVGDISVAIIFPESNGSIDPNIENWSLERKNQVILKIQSALDWWASQEPKARVKWIYNIYTIETGYEPILHSDEWDWVKDVMSHFGYTSGYAIDRTRAFDNDLRNSNKTDWAFIIFVVDSLNDADGAFPDGTFAYSYRGGPYAVVTYDNSYWGINNMNKVVAHEIGHTFRACDEYCQAGYSCCSCSTYCGYLNELNKNCEAGCPEGNCNGGETYCNGCFDSCYVSDCLMDNNAWCLSPSTIKHVGWRDKNNNSILDVMDSQYNPWIDSDGDKIVDYWDDCPNTAGLPEYYGCPFTVTISSPQNKTYTSNPIQLTFTINQEASWIGYSLDNQANITITGNTTLTGLTGGSHNLKVYATDNYGNTAKSDVNFNYVPCICSEWRPLAICCRYPYLQKYVRTCNPIGCDITTVCMRGRCAL